MKLRLIAVFLILFVAAWLPIIAQQSSTAPATPQAQPAKPDSPKADSSAAGCCHGKDAKTAHAMTCCEGKDAKGATCCKKDADGKQVTATCCKGKDGKMCAKNSSKGCCDDPTCKVCCGKSAASTDATDPNAKTCCADANHRCCHSKAQA